MKHFLLILFAGITFSTQAQKLKSSSNQEVITQHSAVINGVSLKYRAKVGMLPVWSTSGDSAIASLNYTYYTRNGVDDISKRPLLISFNGGPGSASVWMHIAYTGPKLLNVDDEGYPIQPYGVKDNPHSLLDVADILYVNPVNTGYSRTVETDPKKVKREAFFGINADITYLAAWLTDFMNKENRWLSPKFLIGESYGGTRVSGLAHELQSKQWMYLNGVVLVSPADYLSFESDRAISAALFLPYYTAAAWYHKKLPLALQSKSLENILPEVEQYTLNILMPAIAKGGALLTEEKTKIANQLEAYTSIPSKAFMDYHLCLPPNYFWKNLLADEQLTIGRLDSRYKGLDAVFTGTKPDYNAELTAWLQAFTPAINSYMQTTLKFKTDLTYNMFGNVHPWDKENNNTRENLRQAMAINPHLKVLFQTGLYDGATTYFHSKYSMWQLDPSGKLTDRMSFKTYPSGHMMYLRKDDLIKSTSDLRDFILESVEYGVPVRH